MIAITISIWFSWFYFFQILQYFVTTTTTQSYQTSKCETASKEVFQSILFINSGFKWWVWMYLKVHFRIRFFLEFKFLQKFTYLGEKSQWLISSTYPKTRYSIRDLSVFWLILLLFKKENWNYSHTLYLLTRYIVHTKNPFVKK